MELGYQACQDDSGCLILNQTVEHTLQSPSDRWWLKCLAYPDERYQDDEEMQSIMWCPQKGCRLNHQGQMESKYQTNKHKINHHSLTPEREIPQLSASTRKKMDNMCKKAF
jgi:hypothetical protein